MVKRNIQYMPTPEHEQWQIPLMNDILRSKHGNSVLHWFDTSVVNKMASIICSSQFIYLFIYLQIQQVTP